MGQCAMPWPSLPSIHLTMQWLWKACLHDPTATKPVSSPCTAALQRHTQWARVPGQVARRAAALKGRLADAADGLVTLGVPLPNGPAHPSTMLGAVLRGRGRHTLHRPVSEAGGRGRVLLIRTVTMRAEQGSTGRCMQGRSVFGCMQGRHDACRVATMHAGSSRCVQGRHNACRVTMPPGAHAGPLYTRARCIHGRYIVLTLKLGLGVIPLRTTTAGPAARPAAAAPPGLRPLLVLPALGVCLLGHVQHLKGGREHRQGTPGPAYLVGDADVLDHEALDVALGQLPKPLPVLPAGQATEGSTRGCVRPMCRSRPSGSRSSRCRSCTGCR